MVIRLVFRGQSTSPRSPTAPLSSACECNAGECHVMQNAMRRRKRLREARRRSTLESGPAMLLGPGRVRREQLHLCRLGNLHAFNDEIGGRRATYSSKRVLPAARIQDTPPERRATRNRLELIHERDLTRHGDPLSSPDRSHEGSDVAKSSWTEALVFQKSANHRRQYVFARWPTVHSAMCGRRATIVCTKRSKTSSELPSLHRITAMNSQVVRYEAKPSYKSAG
jgi:hypothetical protein